VYSIVNGGEKEYDQIYKLFKESEMQEEKLRALRALGFTQDPNLLNRSLKMSLSEEVRSQDLIYVIATCGAHKKGRELTWSFFKENFAQFENRLKDSMMLFERVVTASFDGFTSEEKAEDAEKFFTAHPVASAERGIKQTLEKIRSNAKWVQTNRANVAKFLAQ